MIPVRWFFFVPGAALFVAACLLGWFLVHAVTEFNDPVRIIVLAGLWVVAVSGTGACCAVAAGAR